MAEWYSMLPTAPNIATGTQAAALAASQARQGSAAADRSRTDADEAAYNLKLKQTVEAMAAASIDPQTGRPSSKRFYALARQSPVGMAAIKAYSETMYPQMAREAAQMAVGASANAEGGIDYGKYSDQIQANPDFAGTLLTQGRDLQKGGYQTAADIAGNKLATGMLTGQGGGWAGQKPGAKMFSQDNALTPAGKAEPTSLVGNEQMEAVAPAMGAAAFKVPKSSEMSPQNRAETIAGLKAKGFALTDKSSPEEIDAAMNDYIGQAVSAITPGFKPGDVGGYVKESMEAQAKAPAVAQAAVAGLQEAGVSRAGARLGQTGTAQGIAQSATSFQQTQDVVTGAKKAGFSNVNAGNAGQFMEAKTSFDWLQSTYDKAAEIKDKVKSGKIDPDTFNAEVNALLNAPMVAESISTEAGRAKFMETLRLDPSFDAVWRESGGNPLAFIKTGAAAKLSAQSQAKVLEILSTIVKTQLESGQAKSRLDQFRGWSKQKPGAKPGTVDSDPLGIRK